MSGDRIDELLAEYRSAFERGEADPTPFLDQLGDPDRRVLDLLIDQFLLNSPRRNFDASAYEGSRPELVVNQAVEAIEVDPVEISLYRLAEQGWPSLLPALRNRMKIKRGVVVRQLAEALGAKDDREVAEVADYYHDMEFGTLPAQGVSRKVLSALAGIYEVSTSLLSKSGEMPTIHKSIEPAPLYTRQLSDKAFMSPPVGPAGDEVGSEQDSPPEPSRIARLFTEG